MVFAMVDSTKGHGEFVTDLKRKTSLLREAHMMRMRGSAAADQAGLLGDKAKVLLERIRIAQSLWRENISIGRDQQKSTPK